MQDEVFIKGITIELNTPCNARKYMHDLRVIARRCFPELLQGISINHLRCYSPEPFRVSISMLLERTLVSKPLPRELYSEPNFSFSEKIEVHPYGFSHLGPVKLQKAIEDFVVHVLEIPAGAMLDENAELIYDPLNKWLGYFQRHQSWGRIAKSALNVKDVAREFSPFIRFTEE